MKFIEPSCYEKKQKPGMDGLMEMMAYAGRLTRNCENKVGGEEDSVKNMMKLGHGRVFEFGTVYLIIDTDEGGVSMQELAERMDAVDFYYENPYSRVNKGILPGKHYITTNYRVLLKGSDKIWGDSVKSGYANSRFSDLKFMTEDNVPTKFHEQRKTIVWDYGISRATADSFRTHCGLSTLMMSTRYCNYGSSKFHSTVTLSRSHWLTNPNVLNGVDYTDKDIMDLYYKNLITPQECAYLLSACNSEKMYLILTGHPKLSTGDKMYMELWDHIQDMELKSFAAEDARGCLGLDLATKMIQCGYVEDWSEFFRQRANADEHPHPDAIYIATKAKEQIDWL